MEKILNRYPVDESGEPLQALSPAAASVLMEMEGYTLDAYADKNGRHAIGFGYTGVIPEALRTRHELPMLVHEGLRITQDAAEDLFLHAVGHVEAAVRNKITVPLSQNEFDALVLLGYNIGVGGESAVGLTNSTLARYLNQGERSAAAEEFERWRYAEGEVLPALEARRRVERAMFERGLYDFTPYDGDLGDASRPRLSDAIIPPQDRVDVSPPVSEPRPSLRGTRTLPAARQGTIAQVIALVMGLMGTLQQAAGVQFLGLIPGWAAGIVTILLAVFAIYQFWKIAEARQDDFIRRAR